MPGRCEFCALEVVAKRLGLLVHFAVQKGHGLMCLRNVTYESGCTAIHLV